MPGYFFALTKLALYDIIVGNALRCLKIFLTSLQFLAFVKRQNNRGFKY